MQSTSWPLGKRVALSVTFDDARASQIGRALPILDAFGTRGTFYVSFPAVETQLESWRAAYQRGHEIGNHTWTHPCSGNFAFARHKALEDWSLQQMQDDIEQANDAALRYFGTRPSTFAYPCGQKFVGRGTGVHSYVPLIAQSFVAARGFRDEAANDPRFCDLSQLMGVDADGCAWDELKAQIETAREHGGWLIFAAHEVGDSGRQTMPAATLEALCRYAQDEQNEVWIETVDAIARHVLLLQSTL